MDLLRLLLTIIVLALTPGSGGAETLGQKLKAGTQKAGQVVKRGAAQVGETVNSTVDLAKPDPNPQATRDKLDAMAAQTLANLFATNPAAQAQFDISAGYAVFDTRKATLLGVVAGFGKGVAVSKTTGARTYMNMGTGVSALPSASAGSSCRW